MTSHPTVVSRFNRDFAIDHPFVCAGMAFICDTADLGIAVCQAGGVGALAGSLLSPPVLKARIREIRAATTNPFHVNLLAAFPYDDQVSVCIEEGVPIVSFHWGLPEKAAVKRLHSAGIKIWAQIGSIEQARAALDLGMDGIVVQGSEAGGHNYGALPLQSILPRVRDAVGDDMTLLAAGGIADGRTAAAAFALGADAIWVGTRMVATTEANAHPEYKEQLISATGEGTVLTSVFGPEAPAFNPMRVLRSDIIDTWQDRVDELPTERSDLKPIGTTIFAGQLQEVKLYDSILPVPETTGDILKMPLLSGQGVGLIDRIEPAGEVLMRMMQDAANQLRKAAPS